MLTIIGGPMFSGKTTWLLDHIQHVSPDSFLLFKPAMDTRYATDACVTHDGQSFMAQSLDHQQPVFPNLEKNIQTILVDELNFFETESLQKAIQKLLKQKIHVIGAGLLYDFNRQPFGATLPLSKKADRFIELFAICDGCGGTAAYNYRKIEKKDQVLLGASETYGACCASCWKKYTDHQLTSKESHDPSQT